MSLASEYVQERSFAGWCMNDSEVPTADPCGMEVRGIRPIDVIEQT